MISTVIDKSLGLEFPIFQGGMAWVADASLAAGVSNAGGLGLIAAMNSNGEQLRAEIKKCKELTDKPFGVNIMLMSPFVEEAVQVVIEEGIKVITTGAGNPGKYMQRWLDAGIKVIPVVPSVALARKMEKLGAFALTEPGAGTDAQGAQTKAVLDGDEWVLNGSKCFITNGKVADVYIVIAITSITEDKRGRKKKNFSAFIVDKGAPGFSFGTKEKKMGIRGSSTYELIFEDARIPKDALLGKEGRGFPIAMHTLDGGRIGIAAQALGIAEGALERTIEYTKERKQFGRSIAQQQNTQFKLADMATRIDAAKYLVYAAAMKKAEFAKNPKVSYSVDAAKAKLFAAETAMAVTTECVQLFGGYGYIREYDVERMMRDAKITEIYEGTSEVQRMVISANLLK